MAAVAIQRLQQDDPLRDDCIQMPFLFPRPQFAPTRDSTKAQKMLGLMREIPRPRSATVDMPSFQDPTKAKRTLGIVTDLPRDRRSWRASVSGGEVSQGKLEQLLAEAEENVRSMRQDEDAEWKISPRPIERGNTQSTTRGWIDIALEHEPTQMATPPHSDTPHIEALQDSPLQLSTVSPIDLDAELSALNGLSPTRPTCSPRPRPASFASSGLQIHSRPHNKIASSRSRGLRANTYPNFSRPIAPAPVPGEEMERDPLYLRYQDEPPTPASPLAKDGRNVFDGLFAARAQIEEHIKRTQTETVPARPKKTRWSSLPISLLQFTKRRSKTEDENNNGSSSSSKKSEGKKKARSDLTEDNLQRWEDEVGYVPKIYVGYDVLRSPEEMDMYVSRTQTPTPTLDHRSRAISPEPPNLANLSLHTPPSSPPQHQAPFASTSKPPSGIISRPITPSLPTPPLDVPQRETTLAAQKESLSRLIICTICRENEHPSTFPERKITSNCQHMTRTCKECLQQWVEMCMETRGWSRCTCPECGEGMRREDVRAFMGVR